MIVAGKLELALAFALGTAAGCVVPNTEHCLHRDFNADAWCASTSSDRPFCSPCEAANFGCVSTQPTAEDCPEYTPGAPFGGSDTGTAGTTN